MNNRMYTMIGLLFFLTTSLLLHASTVVFEVKVLHDDGQPITQVAATTQLPSGILIGTSFNLGSHKNCSIIINKSSTLTKEQLAIATDEIYLSITGEEIFQ